jgi:outer membrane protein assembly factor BamD (BamD/ComL family)
MPKSLWANVETGNQEHIGMPKDRMRWIALAVGVVVTTCSVYSTESQDGFLQAVADTKALIDTGQEAAAQDAFDALKADFPTFAGDDLDLFVKGELYFCKDRYTKAVKHYEKLLTNHPRSPLCEAALDREFTIATAYLAGRKKTVLGFIKFKGYAEGIRIMEKITDRVGLDSTMGTDASLAVAKNYEERKLYNEAYLKWWELSLHWNEGPVGRDALLGMARNKLAAYNKYPELERHMYDASGLSTAKSCYSRFKLLYPVDARQIGVDKILEEIDEQLACKQLSIGQYYQSTGHIQAAKLYYRMVVSDWPDTQAARTAKDLLKGLADFKQ